MKPRYKRSNEPSNRWRYVTGRIAGLLIMFSFMAGSATFAQVYPEAYLEEALQNNPGILAAQKSYEASLHQADITSALPDPELSAGFFTPPMERLMGNQWFDVRIMQMFPWFGTLEKRRTVAGYHTEETHHLYRDRRNGLFMEMTRLWLEIYKKEQQMEVLRQSAEILRKREDLIYSRYEGGRQDQGIALDIFRMEIEIADTENRFEKLVEEKTSLVRSFNILAGRDETAGIETPDSLPAVTDAAMPSLSGRDSFENNPRVSMARARTEAAEIGEELSRLATRPMLGVGLQYSYFAPGSPAMGQMDGGHMIMPMVSITLPVFGNKNRATRQQGMLQAEAEAFRESDQVNILHVRYRKLEAEFLNIRRDHDFYQQQLEITRKAMDLVLSGYAAGSEGFDELLRLHDQVIDLEWRMLEAKVNHHFKLAEMDMLLARNIFE